MLVIHGRRQLYDKVIPAFDDIYSHSLPGIAIGIILGRKWYVPIDEWHAHPINQNPKPICQTSSKTIQTTTALTVEDFSNDGLGRHRGHMVDQRGTPDFEPISMIPWDKLHGAMTHFPIALLLFSTACDFVSVTLKKLPFARELRLASFYALAVAALASLGAVISGIALSKGDLWGRGDFGWHHRFVWPAFGLLVALAVWRLVVREAMSRFGLCLYLCLMLLASGLVAAAGYFGGELLLSGGGVP